MKQYLFRIVSYGYHYPLAVEGYFEDEPTRWANAGHIEMSGFTSRVEAEQYLPQIESVQQAYKSANEA